jgi:hypothetical protein
MANGSQITRKMYRGREGRFYSACSVPDAAAEFSDPG